MAQTESSRMNRQWRISSPLDALCAAARRTSPAAATDEDTLLSETEH